MQCPHCRFENREDVKFCEECGEIMQLVCPGCGAILPPRSNFCNYCGHALRYAGKRGSMGGAPAFEIPKFAPDAERKQITALFSDLTGYTAMTGQLDPEDVQEITGKIFQEIKQVVARYDGFIEKFAGDGALILFGVPQAHEDDPVRAIRAAREIHDCVDAISPLYESRLGRRLTMHSGINTGLAVTAKVDSLKGTHGVTGEAINIAARLSDLAVAGQILVGFRTARATEGYFVFRDLGTQKVSGKAKPISIYELVSPREKAEITHRITGLRAELTGRSTEMAGLSAAVKRLRDGEGSIVCICGHPGTGKSRLVHEFKSTLDLNSLAWFEGHSYPYSQNIPYFPLIDLMNRAWRIDEADPPEKIREKIELRLNQLLENSSEAIPYIGSLYALSYPQIEQVGPESWLSRFIDAVKAVVESLARQGPTVFCFEDIHWADQPTLDLLRAILAWTQHPALFLCVYRLPFSLFPESQNSLPDRVYEEIRLQDLSPDNAYQMLLSLFRIETLPGELSATILKKTEGNPFYLEEVTNSLIDTGILIQENNHLALTRAITESDVPSTVQGVIMARIDRLSREMKLVLQEASVIGRAFAYDIVKRISQIRDNIDSYLQDLERLDIIRTMSVQPELEYMFKHALTQEVVYNGLLRKERQEIHERIGTVMEDVFHDRLQEFFETLAFHFKQGQSVYKAVEYLLKSGEKCLKKYAVEESDRYFREAYDLLVEQPGKKQAEKELLVSLLIKWSFVFHYRGDFKGLRDLLTRHKALAIASSDRTSLGMYYNLLGLALYETEKISDAHQCLREALVLGEETGDSQVIGYACSWLTWVCPELGLFHEAIDYGERAKRIAAALTSEDYLFFNTVGGMGVSYYLSGDLRKGFECGRMLLEHAQRYENIRSKVLGHFVTGCCHSAAGDIPCAIESLQHAIKESIDPWYSLFPRFIMGVCLISTSRFQEAEKTLGKVLEHSRIYGTELIGRPTRSLLAVCAIAEGRLAEGLKTLQRLQVDHLSNQRLNAYAVGEHILGKLYSELTPGSGVKFSVMKNLGFLLKNMPFARRKAREHFNRSIKVSEEIGAKCVSGMAYQDLGLLYQRMGKKNLSRDCLLKARKYFEKSGAEAFLSQMDKLLRSSV